MKFNFLKDKSGNPIGLKAFETTVFDKNGRNLIDKITSINTKILYIQDSMVTINARIEKIKGPVIENELEEALKNVTIREDSESNICLLSDNNGKVSSEYGYDYQILAGLLYDGNYSEYIKDGDWIELTTPDGGSYKMYANIDTYYGEGEDDDHKIGHHIDFISDNLIYGSTSRTAGANNYSATDINSWRMNNDTTYSNYGNNNGVATEESPFLANSTTHRGSEGGIIDKLDAYYNDNIASGLKGYIIKKYHNVPTRYQSGTVLTDDNGSKWSEMPYLWIPYEWEVWGSTQYATNGYETHMKQYHSFSSKDVEFRKKIDKKDTSNSSYFWWTASTRSKNAKEFCYVHKDGSSYYNDANYWCYGAPLCFRFGAKFYTNKPIIRPDFDTNICLLKDDNGTISSEYNYTYDFLADVLDSDDYASYIMDGDWIELTTADGATYKMYANVDTYYGEGEDDDHKIGHHIDFISDNLIYGSTSRENGKAIYSATDINSWRMNYDTTYSEYGSNNGVTTEASPFLANSTEHRGSQGGIIDKLNAYYNDNINDILKSYIIKKYHKVPTRLDDSRVARLTDDNGSKWAEMPYLWIPYYREVWGDNTTNAPTPTYESHMKQYHSFSSKGDSFRIKADKKDTSNSWNWWTASAKSNTEHSYCAITATGVADASSAYLYYRGAPLCFRFAKVDPINGKRPMGSSNICLLKDDKGTVTSKYGFTYDNLADILDSGEYSNTIKDGDWIELTTADGATYNMYANIDTYYGEGEEGKEIGHHIDFISDNLIYGSSSYENGAKIYSTTDINSWRMNNDTTYTTSGSNNGVATEESPFLANSTEHRGVEGGIIDKLNAYYSDNISEGLKSHIVKKYHKVPTRYQSGSSLTYDNGSKWAEMPYLWIPYYKEVWGDTSNTYMPTSTHESHMKQYHSFSSNSSFTIKGDKKDTNTSMAWWTASAQSGNSYIFCGVGAAGGAGYGAAFYWYFGAPLCFRFMKNKPYDKYEDIIKTGTTNVCLLSDNNGVVTSNYGFTYDKLADILDSGEYAGYIKDGDWIELNTPDGGSYKMYANIDTYYGEGEDDDHKIGHHIDFISEELIYGSVGNNGSYNYSSTNINSWRMNNANTNNGVATEESSFLANSTDHRGSEGGIIDKLDAYYTDNISDGLKRHIIKKYHKVTTRYDGTNKLTADNGSKWAELPYLWIPYFKEIWGTNERTYEIDMIQYHSFASISNFRIKYDKKYSTTSPSYWWTATAYAGNNYDHMYCVWTSGNSGTYVTQQWNVGAPLCFRFAKVDPINGVRPAGMNLCLLKDDNGTVTSDYGFTYDKLADILDSGNYSNCIKDGDWIELNTPDGGSYTMYANIDTYYGEGEEGKEIGHHIDFISKELIYGSTSKVNGSSIYSATDINSWRMNRDGTNGNNNGVATESSPFLANSTQHRGSEGGIIDKLDNYYSTYIPERLKSHIVKKYHNVPTRYQSGSTLTDDNGSKWAEMPYLWIPYMKEVWGDSTTATSYINVTYESHMKQYHSFINIPNFTIKSDAMDTTTNANWWTASAKTGSDIFFCYSTKNGFGADEPRKWNIGAPLCFRFMKNKPYDKYEGIIKTGTTNVCLLSDNNGVVTSNYGFTYDKLADILDSGEYAGYIKDGDWLELSTPDGGTYKMYANIDTYYGEGEDDDHKIGHHIDFISDNLIYGSTSRIAGSAIYSSTDINSWRMNYDTTYTSDGSNNGVSTEESPFLANCIEHRGAQGGIIDKLNAYYSTNISESLKAHIVKKYHKVPTRYQSGTGLTDDNGTKWTDMSYLWIPYYKEVWGDTSNSIMPTTTYETHMKQYQSFTTTSFRIKKDNKNTGTSDHDWWTASARSGYNNRFCRVVTSGDANCASAYNYLVGSPLCFRFMKNKPYDKYEGIVKTGTTNVCLLSDNNGVVTSNYGFTYDKLADILDSGEYAGYIKDGDWIELNTPDGGSYKMYANVDTYYGEGEEGKEIGHHIDFISDNLIYGSYASNNGSPFSSTNINSWRMNQDTTYITYGYNNGVSTETSPFLANSTGHRGGNGGIIDKLDTYYTANISNSLKSYIVKKYHKVPTRYSTSTLKDDNGSKWAEMPYLWIPYEKEVFGKNTYANSTYESHMKHYHSFSSITNFAVKYDKRYSSSTAAFWWMASAYSGDAYRFCRATNSNSTDIGNAYDWIEGAPLCFRFMKVEEYTGGDNRPTTSPNICLLKDDNGIVTSDYGFTYDNISEILASGNYSGYIKDGDWIELKTADGGSYTLYANIDTYYGEGEEGKEIGHHIDFISKELIYGSTSKVNGSNLYTNSSTQINSWRMNAYKTNYSTGCNNGTYYDPERSPFLANSTAYRGSTGGIIDKLSAYYNTNINDVLKAHIIKKYHKIPIRYDASFTATADNGSKWAELPYLWVPYYREIWGDVINDNKPTATYESHMKKYHSFSNVTGFLIKRDYKDTTLAADWWTASASTGNYSNYCSVRSSGVAYSSMATIASNGVPLCFRFQ